MARHTKPGIVRVGISGWRYGGWRGVFYPEGLRQASELHFASRAVSTIEINGTHYRLQSPKSFGAWYDETPPSFVFSVKGSRYLTHILRFRDEAAQAAMANFFAQGVFLLREKLGPILWQFPPTFKFEAGRFEAILAMLPKDGSSALELAERHDRHVKQPYVAIDRNRPMRHAIEIRHDSFRDATFIKLLRKYHCGLVVSDATANWPCVQDLTSDFVYLRLHGTQTKYAGEYTDASLDRWAARIRQWAAGNQPADARLIAPDLAPRRRSRRDVFCYFDNDTKSQAPFDARRLAQRLDGGGKQR